MIAGSSLLADTMVVIWYVLAPEKLSATARDALVEEADTGRAVLVSAFSVVELVYLMEKGTVTGDEFAEIMRVLDDPDGPFVVTPLTLDSARGVAAVPRVVPLSGDKQSVNNDPGDRMIAATAVDLGLRLVSSDIKLRILPRAVADLDVLW